MINPNTLEFVNFRFNDRARGTKHYRVVFDGPNGGKTSRKQHKTATEAQTYGARVMARWIRLYNAAIAQMVQEA